MEKRGYKARTFSAQPGTCRLCPSKDDLQDIFKQRNVDMPQIILSTTGIEIKQDDPMSKQLCARCQAIIIRLYKYKIAAVTYDNDLKKQHGLPISPITSQVDPLKTKRDRKTSENTNSKTEMDFAENLEISGRSDESVTTNRNKNNPKAEYKHHSVYKLLSAYKNLVIPKEVLSSDINPVILLDKKEVTTWYEEQLLFLRHKFKGIKFKKMPNSVNLNRVSENKKRLFKEKPLTSDTSKTVSSTKIISDSNTQSPHKFVSNKNGQCSFPSLLNVKPFSDRNKSVTSSLNENSDKMSVSPKISGDVCNTQNGNSVHFESSSNDQNINLTDLELVSSHHISLLNNQKNINKRLTSEITEDIMKNCVNNNNGVENKSSTFKTEQTIEIKRKRLLSNNEDESVLQKKRKPSSKLEENKLETHKKYINEFKKSRKSESVPELVQGKTLEIFLCNYCNTLFDTKNQLIDHEKAHLTCQFCKKSMGNVELLRKHTNETCLISIAQNLPIIQLTRVDDIPDVLLQYPNAFKSIVEKELNTRCSIEQILFPESTDNNLITHEDVLLTTNLNSFPQINRLSPLCMSNESNDVGCEEIVQDSNIQTKNISPLTKFEGETIDLTDESSPNSIPEYKSVVIFQNNMSEYDAIRIIFRKHVDINNGNISCLNDKFTQIFHPTESGVIYTTSNLIILDGLFPDLSNHQIPIQFLSRSRINVTFNTTLTTSSQLENSVINEIWKLEDCVDIKNCRTPCSAVKTITPCSAVKTITPTNQNSFSSVVSDMLKQIPCLSIDNSVLLNAHSISSTPFNTILQQTASTSMPLASVTNNTVQRYSKSFLFNNVQSSATITGESVVISTVTHSTDNDNGKTACSENIVNISNNITNISKIFALPDNASLLK